MFFDRQNAPLDVLNHQLNVFIPSTKIKIVKEMSDLIDIRGGVEITRVEIIKMMIP